MRNLGEKKEPNKIKTLNSVGIDVNVRRGMKRYSLSHSHNVHLLFYFILEEQHVKYLLKG